MTKFRKLPVIVDAIKYDGTNALNIIDHFGKGQLMFEGPNLYVETLEGRMCAQRGDYIIKGVIGEMYPCKAEVFEKSYEAVIT